MTTVAVMAADTAAPGSAGGRGRWLTTETLQGEGASFSHAIEAID